VSAPGSMGIPVDLSNPGQFFACCGIFELADRRWPDADVCAHFEGGRFLLKANEEACSLPRLLAEFADAGFDILDPKEFAASGLRVHAPFGLRLDWWRSDAGGGGAAHLKTWAGKQHGPTIFRLMKQAVGRAVSLESPFDYSEGIFDSKDGKAKRKTISPFYFDSRREGTSLDLGFSPDEQDMSVEAYPAVDSLALVGLQRFRPCVDAKAYPRSFVYVAWAEPLPVSVAAATVCGAVAVRSCGSFRFTRPSRGGEYVTMFSRATRERSKDV
jgi:hypothetical protein